MKNYSFKIDGKDYNVSIEEAAGATLTVNVNGAPYQVELEQEPTAVGNPEGASALKSATEGVAPVAAPAAKPASQAAGRGAEAQVPSPLPGVIVEVSVKEGQAVKAGQKVAVLEAMKMENEIPATRDGVISAIHVNKGDSVLEGAPIVSIA